MSVPKAVPSAVASSTQNSVPVLTEPQLGPYEPMSGSQVMTQVPRSDELKEKELNPQPEYGGAIGSGSQRASGGAGAPSVPVRGFLYSQGPIDTHYQSRSEDLNPYHRVNNPPTRGMFTWIKDYLNHIAFSQNTDNTGFKINGPQQRTSYMRVTPPPHGMGYAPEPSAPYQLPQSDATYKYNPTTGTDPYGTGVLNSETFGAGQTAGGIGGNQYTPTPGPPDTNSTANAAGNPSGMPTWG